MNISDMHIGFSSPLLLICLVPAAALTLLFFFRIPKNVRRTKSRRLSLVLRMLALCLSALTAAGMMLYAVSEAEVYDLVFVVDASDSCAAGTRQMDEYLHRVLWDEDAGSCRVSIVTYAGDCVTAVKHKDDAKRAYEDYLTAPKAERSAQTDISAALEYAADLIENKQNGRLILLSDGKQTAGDAVLTAQRLAEDGIMVDAVYFDCDSTENEVQINRVRVENELSQKQLTEVLVTLRSSMKKPAVLSLYDNGSKVREQQVELSGGTDTFSLPYFFNDEGVHELRTEIECEGDTRGENNTYFSYVKILPRVSVLVIDGSGSDAELMAELMVDNYDFDIVSPSQVPTSRDKLYMYDEIIMLNADMADLPYDYDAVLKQYVTRGGGLLTVGGRGTYLLGNMENTYMEDLLPVQLRDEDSPSIEIMIVLDISSSMNAPMSGSGKTRLDVAKEGVMESVTALRDRDYVGIITFDANAHEFVPISPATSRDDIIAQIYDISAGYGTAYGNALTMAQSRLISSQNDAVYQHVIFITDGKPSDSNYAPIIESMSQRGITLSSVAICQNDGSTDDLIRRVQQMALVGRGRSYVASGADEFPDIMRTETLLSPKKLIIEGSAYSPERNGYSEVSAGVSSLPAIYGYYNMKKKEGAQVPFTVNHAPLFAMWQYGDGKVGSLMCDIGGEFSPSMLTEEDGVTFVKNMVKCLQHAKPAPKVTIEADRSSINIFYRTEPAAGHSVMALISCPDGELLSAEMKTSSMGGYTGHFFAEKPGIYRIQLLEKDDRENSVSTEQAYTSVSYSKEYDMFSGKGDGEETLRLICDSTNGSVLDVSEPPENVTAEPITLTADPSIFMLVAIMVLCVADIAVRKFLFTR